MVKYIILTAIDQTVNSCDRPLLDKCIALQSYYRTFKIHIFSEDMKTDSVSEGKIID